MIIAVMHWRKHPSKVSRMYPLAAICKLEGVDFYYFTPRHVNFENKTVRGYHYDDGWKKKTFPFPDIVLNSSRLRTTKQIEVRRRLKNYVLFSESKIGSKKAVDSILKKSYYKKNLPETIKVRSRYELYNFIDKYKRVVLKPSVGARGESIYFIVKENTEYKIFYQQEVFTDLEGLLDSIDLDLYLAQRYIDSKTKMNLPVDYRIHTQKDGNGNYVITKIYPRVAPKAFTVTNISQGSYSVYIKPFLRQNFENADEIYTKLKVLGIGVSKYLDNHYHNLNELGLDVCIEDGIPYIIEVNWRPGSIIQFFSSYEHLVNLVRYSIYKVKNNQ